MKGVKPMKKTVFIAVLLALALCLAACGSETKTNTAVTNNSAAPAANSSGNQNNSEDYYFQKGDVKIHMNEASDPILEKLGKYKSSYEAPSCAFDGMDVVYTYPGFDLMTFVDKGKGKVSGVVLRDDTVETVEGISIGSSAADVEKAYGKLEDGATNKKLQKGSCELLIILTDGAVSSIQYLPVTE